MMSSWYERSCDRCGQDMNASTMSYFNKDKICMECRAKEHAHPKFQEAFDREHEEVAKGNMNFPGIGLPEDL